MRILHRDGVERAESILPEIYSNLKLPARAFLGIN